MDSNQTSPLVLCEAQEEGVVRRASREAEQAMQRPGVYGALIASLLLCLTAVFALVSVMEVFNLLFWQLSRPPALSGLWQVWQVFYWVLGVLGTFLLILPLWLGRIRMAGCVLIGASPCCGDVLYYFGKGRRYGRAVGIGLILALQAAIPTAACGFAVKGVLAAYEALTGSGQSGLALGVLIVGLLLSLGVAVLGLFWSGLWLMFTAVAVGNETLSLKCAMGSALRGGRRLGTVFRFTLLSLWHLLLSVVSIGVLFVLRYAHRFTLSYLRLSMILCPKGEN